jgi:hypothetical protein
MEVDASSQDIDSLKEFMKNTGAIELKIINKDDEH